MAVTLKADVSGSIPNIIRLLVESLFSDKLFMPFLVTRDYSGELAMEGDRVTVNAYGSGTAGNAAGGFTPEALSESGVAVIMDAWKVAAFNIDNQASSMGIHDWEKVIQKRTIEPIANAFEDALLALYTDASTNNHTATGTNGGISYDDLPVIRRMLVAQNADVNKNGRYNLVASTFDIQEMLLEQKFIDASYAGDGGQAIKEAYIGHKGGFDIFESNRIPVSGAGPYTYHSMAFGESAMGFVTRSPGKPLSGDKAVTTFEITDTRSDITMRITMSFNHTGGFYDTISCDLFYGVKTMNESHMVDVTSVETP